MTPLQSKGVIYILNENYSTYLEKIDKAFKQVEEGKVVVKTIEELEAITNE